MKKLLALLLLPALAQGSTFNLFSPAAGILKGATTTYVTTAAASSDVIATFSGSCSAASFLRADGACSIIYSSTEPQSGYSETDQGTDLKNWLWDINGGVVAFGTATDAAPSTIVRNAIAITRGTTTAISNISLGNTTNNPTFTLLGTGLFTAGNGLFTVSSSGTVTNATTLLSATAPSIRWNESDQGTDLKNWNINVNGAVMTLCTATDAASGTCVKNAMTVVRGSTTVIGSQTFGNATDNPTFTFLGTGALTASGAALLPGLASSSAAQTGTLCWTTGTGNITVDTTTTCLLSTRRVKKDIAPLDAGLAEVMALQPVSYELKPEHDPGHLGRQVGLISEDVGAIDPRLISHEADGTPLGVRYQQLTAVLVKAIQEQQQEIQGLQRRLDKRH